MSLIRRLFAGCWLKHTEVVWQGESLICLTCGTPIEVLPQAIVKGPKHEPEYVRGVPKMHAVKASWVTPIKKRA